MLEIAGLSAKYGSIAALADVTLSVERGQIVSLLGSNGAGKSTLLGCITNSVPCRMSGSIKFEGAEILGLSTEAIIARGLVLVPEGRQLFPELTVEENLRMGAYGFDRGRKWRSDLQFVYNLFPQLVERRRQAAATLSGGEQQMVAIGRALMARPRIVLLDEPSLGLAPTIVDDMFDVIARVRQDGAAVLLVEQNVLKALDVADRAYVLEQGRIVSTGLPADLLQQPHIREAYLGV